MAGAAVLGGTNADVEAGAPPEAGAAPDAAAVEAGAAAPEDAGAAADVGELLELEPQALSTSALAVTAANSIARVVRVWVDATSLPRNAVGLLPPSGSRKEIARSWHTATPNMSFG